MSAEFDKFMRIFREDVWRVRNEIEKEWHTAVSAIKNLSQQLNTSTKPGMVSNARIHVGERQVGTVTQKEATIAIKTGEVKKPKDTCMRCGKKLKNEKSRERGFGPSCYAKQIIENYHPQTLFDVEPLKRRKEDVEQHTD